MNNFSYIRPENLNTALQEVADNRTTKFIAGGTNLIDLMKENVTRPERLVDINRLPMSRIEVGDDAGMRIGALVSNSELAYHEHTTRVYPVLSQAILAGASPQLRNMATVGGNLMQRTRCYYFYDTATACHKRDPGSGCAAIDGCNRIHAILGTSEKCIAVHPSDMCVALAALEAIVHVTGLHGDRQIPFAEFHRLPGSTPELDTNLQSDEIITSVELPPSPFSQHSAYLKIRDRESYAFALVSVAAALRIEDGTIVSARIALGGVAHKPWRDRQAEEHLEGQTVSVEAFQSTAEILLRGARGFGHNDFKIPLARRAVVRALSQAAEGTNS